MDHKKNVVHIENLDEKKRFEVKLQIELYKLAGVVAVDERKDDFIKYQEERVDKIRKMLNMEHGKIYEGDDIIFEF